MADTWDFGENGDTAMLAGDEQPQPIQEKKINKKRLGELEANGKKLQIFTRDCKTGALLACNAIRDVPKDAAAICSDYIYDKLQDGRPYYHVIKSNEIEGQSFVFEWIKTCAAEQNVAQIPDVTHLINEEKGFQSLIDVMWAARKLKIPEASFGKFIIKKSRDSAKQHLPSIELVRKAYDNFPEGEDEVAMLGPVLRELFVYSIFDHWYNYKLDAEEYDEYMEKLGIARQDIPQLDEDLQAAVVDKDNFILAAREKRRNRDAGGNGTATSTDNFGSGGGDDGWPAETQKAVGANDWNQPAVGLRDGTNTWDQPATTSANNAFNEWEYTPAGAVADSLGAGPVDWADEVNDSNNFNPAPLAPTVVW